ncbi:MAG: type VI secretion system contractile sheath large subunit [Thermodesulfobacteriota bacterium]|nr:type VI secretion system contractile sheath large subunit [Thermodesulfobacteriota bacterium]
MQNPSLPFKVLALGPFTLQEKKDYLREPIRVDQNHPDQVIEKLNLSLFISLPQNLCRWDHLSLDLKRFKDFHPDSLIENHPSLKNLLEARKFAEESKTKGLAEEEIYQRLKKWPGLPVEIRFEPTRAREEVSSPVDDILKMVAIPGEDPASPPGSQPFATQMNLVLQQILGQVFSDPDFRNLESTWQGLQFLMKQTGADKDIIFEIVPVSFNTLEETQNHLLPCLVEDLPSLILLDLPFDNSPRCLELLEKVALFSETLLVPTLCRVTPKFLHLDQWGDLGRLPFLPHYFDEPAFAKWRRLKELPSSKWMAVTCNRFLIRYPYGPDNRPRSVHFDESENLWISPVWAAGSLILQSLLKTGWPTRFTEWQSIRLSNLALHMIEGDRGIPTETNFSEERIDQFIRGGITPLVSPLNKDFAFIPKETTSGGSSLSYQLFLSRITHFLFWCKDHFEKDLEPGLLEQNLKKAFSLFWERSGALIPNSLEISVNRQKSGQSIVVKVVIEPSRQMLPSGAKVELELNW